MRNSPIAKLFQQFNKSCVVRHVISLQEFSRLFLHRRVISAFRFAKTFGMIAVDELAEEAFLWIVPAIIQNVTTNSHYILCVGMIGYDSHFNILE